MSLRVRLLAAALTAVVLALIANDIASYVTVKNHNDAQIADNLDTVVSGNAQALDIWFNARFCMLTAMDEAVKSDSPRVALRQLNTSGEGDLTQRLPEEGNAEITQIAAAFNRFVLRMEDVLLEVRSGSEAANEIKALNEESQGRVRNDTKLVQSAAQTMNDIVAQITRVTGEQSDGIGQVNVAVVEESSTAAEQLQEQADYVTAPRPIGRGFPLQRQQPATCRNYASLDGQRPTVLRPSTSRCLDA